MDETALDGYAIDGDGIGFALRCLGCGMRCRDLTSHDRLTDLVGAARLHQTICPDADARTIRGGA